MKTWTQERSVETVMNDNAAICHPFPVLTNDGNNFHNRNLNTNTPWLHLFEL
jgi:hypothetical protein